MEIVNCTLYRDNPYQAMLYGALRGRYEPVRGKIDDAIAKLKANGAGMLHVHWEEHLIRSSPTEVEARAAASYFIGRLKHYRELGGRAIWTIHNSLPHELEHVEAFLSIRRALAEHCDRILVHNTEAINVLSEQVPLDRTKIYYLPHPSYTGIYEPEDTARREVGGPTERSILSFGKIRRYKGTDRLLNWLTPEFLSSYGAKLRISGEPIQNDLFLSELQACSVGRGDIVWDIRNVADRDVPVLMRGASCVVLPYERFLTSGVALLALSVGALVVAPNVQQMRELLPVPVQRFLFEQDSADDFRRAVAAALELPQQERAELATMSLQRASHFRGERISRQLGGLLDSMLGSAVQPA
jgi:glycosyltransferase involved in cell wall biosynthesis